ncbi:hypothetical protein FHR83_006373 [Actinoplanes campanulatus]|uniref:Uncharacterized protein n=1 Tax=Actinoplanes campanulatus TaxID=113559 RepID=A0A7W5AMQ5_9ACTN|nr:hypothetical protein [Actinoplanes campanulatus]MBB3098674.1 hypothetical protein [Actinoplanes campanulatus]GGN36445.1 hypothetical protein GCM10010109_61410 [Actinoplanes campanulatus]GID39364.1 hypothetical protein Aca09nite_58700 [Actinoplanes campanulatus]
MVRTDLVVPARLVQGLRIPSLSVTTGGAEVHWVEVPTSRWRFMRRPAQRLPLDPRSARLARRYLRVEPWASLARLVMLLGWVTVEVVSPSALTLPIGIIFWLTLIVGSIPQFSGVLPRQSPYRTAAGDLRVPQVPIEVAKQWVELNPGVVPTIEPVPRPRSRRWYATWSTVLLVSAIVLFTVLANDGREDSALIWVVVLSLFFIGVATALKTLPPGYIRFEPGDS